MGPRMADTRARQAIIPSMEERSWIEAAKRGDREAMRRLYDRHVGRVFPLLLRMTGREEDAFDLTQETFLRAFERIEAFDGRSAFGTWLYRIAVNEALQQFRKRGTEHRHRAEAAAAQRSRDENVGQAIQRRIEIEDALSRLSSDHRAVLLLRYQEGLDYAAIAEILGCEPGTVASRLNRARAELRGILDEREPAAEVRAASGHRIR